jgi:hypothetical protein
MPGYPALNDPKVINLLDRYAGRISARMAEDSGGVFDVVLVVDGFEIAALRLRQGCVLTYTDGKGGECAIGPDGGLFDLPEPNKESVG